MQKTINKILLVIFSGVLMCLAVLGEKTWWTSLFGLIPLFIVLLKNSLEENPKKIIKENIFACGIFGLIFYSFSLYWLESYGWYAHIGLAVLQTLFLCIFGGLFHFFVLKSEKKSPIFQVARFFLLTVGVGFLWTSVDFLRSLGIFGFQWYSIFHLVAYDRLLIQYISYTGPYFLDFVVVAFSMCAVYFIVKKRPKTFWEVGITEEFCAFVGVMIFIVLHIVPINFIHSPICADYSVALLQGSLDMWEKTDFETLDTYKKLLKKVEKADLYVLPETTFSYLNENRFITKELENFSKKKATPMIVGANTDSQGEGLFNSAVLISKYGVWQTKQNKMRLVPYGEYVPKILPVKTDDMREIDAVPGEEITTLDLAETPIKVACGICYDSSFPKFFREASKKANVFCVISNDWWFGKGFAPENHFMMSVLRAVENRRYLLRCGSNGISGVITPYGEPLKRTKLDEVVALTEGFGLMNEVTLYAKYGDLYPWVGLFLWVIFIPVIWFVRISN